MGFCKDTMFELDEEGAPEMITYDDALDKDLRNVLELCTLGNQWYVETAFVLGLTPNYVQLILHVLSDLDLVEYGGSPRGAWATDTGKKYLKFYKEHVKHDTNKT